MDKNEFTTSSVGNVKTNFYVSLMLSHSIVYFARSDAPTGYDCFNGGDAPAQSTSESTNDILSSYEQHLPNLLQTTADSSVKAAQTSLPASTKLTSDLYKQYGPQLSAISDAINAASAEAQAKSDLNVIKETGRQLVNEGLATQKIVDPEYYNNRATIGNKLNELTSSLNPTGLSEAERAEVERAANQQSLNRGTLNTPSVTDAVSNAMTFGSALQNKQNQVANILNNSANSLGSLQSGVDAYQVATGKPSRSNLGDSKFSTTNSSATDSGTAMSSNFLNGLFGQKAAETSANANRRDSLDRVNETIGTVSNS